MRVLSLLDLVGIFVAVLVANAVTIVIVAALARRFLRATSSPAPADGDRDKGAGRALGFDGGLPIATEGATGADLDIELTD